MTRNTKKWKMYITNLRQFMAQLIDRVTATTAQPTGYCH
jgi:hypothetical protein